MKIWIKEVSLLLRNIFHIHLFTHSIICLSELMNVWKISKVHFWVPLQGISKEEWHRISEIRYSKCFLIMGTILQVLGLDRASQKECPSLLLSGSFAPATTQGHILGLLQCWTQICRSDFPGFGGGCLSASSSNKIYHLSHDYCEDMDFGLSRPRIFLALQPEYGGHGAELSSII